MKRGFWLEVALVWLGAAYILLGMTEVPFHGDESSTIWMSRDFDLIVLNADVDAVAYQPPPTRTTEQHLRIITGNFSKFWMGIGWWSGGFSAEQINDQWVWSPDLDLAWNRANGHMPSEKLLWLSRLTSTLMTVVSVVLVYKMTHLTTLAMLQPPVNARVAGWVAMGLYVSNPAVLINGRRAMFEGGLLLMLALVAWWVLVLLRRWQRLSWPHFVTLGVLTGLAFCTKHSAVFTVVPLYTCLLLMGLWQRDWPRLAGLVGASGLAIVVLYVLSPLWWDRPLDMPRITYEERQAILQLQVDLFGGYKGFDAQLRGFFEQTIVLKPQYYEAQYWTHFAGVEAEIDGYEKLVVAGLASSFVWTLLRLGLLGLGVWGLWQNHQPLSVWLIVWLIGVAVAIVVTVPLGWQRYYLPLQLPLAVTMGVGAGVLSRGIIRYRMA